MHNVSLPTLFEQILYSVKFWLLVGCTPSNNAKYNIYRCAIYQMFSTENSVVDDILLWGTRVLRGIKTGLHRSSACGATQ